MAQNPDGYMPFSKVAGANGVSALSRGASGADFAPAQSRGAPGADFAPAPSRSAPGAEPQHYAEAPRPQARPAPQGYGEPQEPYHSAPAAISAAQGRPVSHPEDAEDDVVVLSKPYTAFGEPVTRIRLRRPVTKDIKVCGNPILPVLAANGTLDRLEIKWDVIAKYIPLLAEPPLTPATVDQFEFADLDACAGVIARFFVRLA